MLRVGTSMLQVDIKESDKRKEKLILGFIDMLG